MHACWCRDIAAAVRHIPLTSLLPRLMRQLSPSSCLHGSPLSKKLSSLHDPAACSLMTLSFFWSCSSCPALMTPACMHAQIKFSNNSFIPAAAEVAARAITNNSATLTHAVMSDIIAGRPETDALQALVILSRALATARLKALDLSGNALGEKGIRAFQEFWTAQVSLHMTEGALHVE